MAYELRHFTLPTESQVSGQFNFHSIYSNLLIIPSASSFLRNAHSKGGRIVLYDLVNIVPTIFTIKKESSFQARFINDSDRKKELSTPNIPQPDENVKPQDSKDVVDEQERIDSEHITRLFFSGKPAII